MVLLSTTLGLILGFITGLLLGVVFILRNETSEDDLKEAVKKIGRQEKGYVIEAESERTIEDLLEVKFEDNDN